MKFIIIYDTDTSNQYNWGFLNKVPPVLVGKVLLCLKTDLFVTVKYCRVTWRRYGNVGKCVLGDCALRLLVLLGWGNCGFFALFMTVPDDHNCSGNFFERLAIKPRNPICSDSQVVVRRAIKMLGARRFILIVFGMSGSFAVRRIALQ